jgi:hypothetical protein
MAYQNPGQISQHPVRVQFQSIDDFMREQEQLDAVRSAEMRARAQAALANSNVKKIKKHPIDVEAVAAEARAGSSFFTFHFSSLAPKSSQLKPC